MRLRPVRCDETTNHWPCVRARLHDYLIDTPQNGRPQNSGQTAVVVVVVVVFHIGEDTLCCRSAPTRMKSILLVRRIRDSRTHRDRGDSAPTRYPISGHATPHNSYKNTNRVRAHIDYNGNQITLPVTDYARSHIEYKSRGA